MVLKNNIHFILLFLPLTGCLTEEPPTVDAKVFSLNPTDYQENIVKVSGKVNAISPGGVLIDAHDKTGTMRISTEMQVEKPNCQIGDKIEASVLLTDVSGQPCLQAQNQVKCSQILK